LHEPDWPSGELYPQFHALGVGWIAEGHSRIRAASAWAWLAAQTVDLREKIRCLEWVRSALEGMRHRLVRENQRNTHRGLPTLPFQG
jgi:hypothetical protein